MSTIITDNPYTFTVSDNMNINAVFENAYSGIIITTTGSDSIYLTSDDGGTDKYTWNLVSGTNKYTTSTGTYRVDNLKSIRKFDAYSTSSSSDSKIKTVDISGTPIRTVPDYAFRNFTALTTFIYSDAVREISSYAFSGCIYLTNITLSKSATTLGSYAFENCRSLHSINLPNSLTTLGENIFNGCTSLTTFTIPDSVVDIYRLSFNNTGWWNNQSDTILYKDNICFGYKTTQTTGSKTITSGTRVIAFRAFQNCTGITSLTLPSGLTNIGNYAFSGCTNISLTIPNTITSIGVYAFQNCTKLTSLTLPSGLTKIGDYAFSGCTNISSIPTIPSSVVDISKSSFNNTGWWNNQSDTILYKDNICFGYKTTQTTGAVSIPSGTRVIANYAFQNCTGITSVSIPDSVVNIGWSAFSGCTGLTSIIIPSSVNKLTNYAFYGCTGLTSITCLATTPPNFGNQALKNTNNCPIYVPAESVDTYKSAFGWSTYADRIQAIP